MQISLENILTDEAYLYLEKYVNKQNCRSENPRHIVEKYSSPCAYLDLRIQNHKSFIEYNMQPLNKFCVPISTSFANRYPDNNPLQIPSEFLILKEQVITVIQCKVS